MSMSFKIKTVFKPKPNVSNINPCFCLWIYVYNSHALILFFFSKKAIFFLWMLECFSGHDHGTHDHDGHTHVQAIEMDPLMSPSSGEKQTDNIKPKKSFGDYIKSNVFFINKKHRFCQFKSFFLNKKRCSNKRLDCLFGRLYSQSNGRSGDRSR